MTTYTKELIKTRITTEPRQAIRALIALYEKQTTYEKSAHQTREANKVGFSAFDAEILTSFAEQFKERGRLTENQIVILKKKIGKYAGQLLKMVEGKI